MAYSKEKQQILVSSLTNIGALVGHNELGLAGGIKGLEMSVEQSQCIEEAKAVHDGLFKIVVMGTFTSGKSTFINALIGEKLLPESALPCTAILTFIQYGTDENHVDVYMADENQADGSVKKGECIQMDIETFKNEYQYTLADEKMYKDTGSVPRFAKVKYAVMYSSKPLIEGGICIIDSPGLQDKGVATELALSIAQKAQAIIYLTLERGFEENDKEYIYSNFKNCPNNIFFGINKFDLVKANERSAALQKMKDEVSPVFKGQDGKVNDELLNRRVFGFSALRALDSQRGMTYDREEDIEVKLDDAQRKSKFEKSWFAPFEQELETFLTTDERCLAQYQNCFHRMASTYRNAEKQISEYLYAYENEIQMDNQKKEECEKIISDIKSSIELTRVTFDNCSLKIQNAVADLLSGCVTDIDRSWEQDMQDLAKKVDVGTFSYMWQGIKQINPLASKASKEESMKRFTAKFIDVVTEYFVNRVDTYITENGVVVDAVVEECQEHLNVSLNRTDDLFKDLTKELLKINPDNNNPSENKNWLQIMISAYLGDFSAVLKGGMEGKAPWIDYLKKTIFNTVWQIVLLSFVDGGLGVLLAIAIEYLQGRNNKSETVKKVLESSKNGIVKAIRENTEEMKDSLNRKIALEMNNEKDKQCAINLQKLDDEQKRMKNIEEFYHEHNTNLEEEKVRFGRILDEMYQEATKAYSVVFDKKLTLDQFKKF